MALSKKLRFEVFKRDGFICQYCGGHPPAIILEVDHVHPKSKGGTDEIHNLVTSCFNCNRGKGKHSLNSIPPSLAESVKMMRERERQVKEYMKLIKNVDSFIDDQIDMVEKIYAKGYEYKWLFGPSFRMSVKRFINSLGLEETKDSMEKAVAKCPGDPNACIKYFCGVCWSKIRERE